MIRTLRALFLGCQLRERLFVVGFLALAALLWLSGFSRRAGQFYRDQHKTTLDLAVQADWIARSPAIEAAAQKAAARLDPAKTLDGTRLLEAVEKMASDAGLRQRTSQPPTNPPGNGQISLHTLDYNVRLVDPDQRKNMASLNKFYAALQDKFPFIGIDQFTVSPDPANRAQLRLQLKVTSVEVTMSH
jgi:hypothetical protein